MQDVAPEAWVAMGHGEAGVWCEASRKKRGGTPTGLRGQAILGLVAEAPGGRPRGIWLPERLVVGGLSRVSPRECFGSLTDLPHLASESSPPPPASNTSTGPFWASQNSPSAHLRPMNKGSGMDTSGSRRMVAGRIN